MREILFRGKRKRDGKWMEGACLHLNLGRDFICDGTVWIGTLNPVKEEVIPETVGQFTGLTDKNGKRIFEGDIIRTDNGKQKAVSVVKQGNFRPKMFFSMLGYFLGYEPRQDMHGLYCENTKEQMALFDSPTCIEVIGNIHDNPELLGGSDDA